jgi:hypothetical protein
VKRNKILFALMLILLSLDVQASQYTYLQKNNTLANYSFNSETSIVPFSEYNYLELCSKRLGEGLNITILDIDCSEDFLFSIVNYLTYIKNIAVVYAKNAPENEIEAATEFAALFNLPIYSDFEVSGINSSVMFIGHRNVLAKTTIGYFDLREGESVIYVSENRTNATIAVIGYNSTYTIAALNSLTDIYKNNFANKGCVILPSCTLPAKTDYFYLELLFVIATVIFIYLFFRARQKEKLRRKHELQHRIKTRRLRAGKTGSR